MVCGVSSPTMNCDGDAVSHAADRARLHHAADADGAAGGDALARDVAGRVEIGRLVLQRRHGEQHRRRDRRDGEEDEDRGAGSCGFTARSSARRRRASRRGASPRSSRRPAPSVAHDRNRIGGDDERPVASRRLPPQPRFDLLARRARARIRISTIAANSSVKPIAEASSAHSNGASMLVPREADRLALVQRAPPQHRIMDHRHVDRPDQAEDRGEPPLPARSRSASASAIQPR